MSLALWNVAQLGKLPKYASATRHADAKSKKFLVLLVLSDFFFFFTGLFALLLLVQQDKLVML